MTWTFAMTAEKKQQEFLHTFRSLTFQIFTVMLMVRIKINTEIELSPLRRHDMVWNGAQDYIRLTNCVQCDTDAYLTDSLCHGCRVMMGYEDEEES